MVNFTNVTWLIHILFVALPKEIYLRPERYLEPVIADPQTFTNFHLRLHENGSFKKNRAGRLVRHQRTLEIEKAILNEIAEHSKTCTRKFALNLNDSHQTIWRIVKEQYLYLYHIERVQAQLSRDFPWCSFLSEVL